MQPPTGASEPIGSGEQDWELASNASSFSILDEAVVAQAREATDIDDHYVLVEDEGFEIITVCGASAGKPSSLSSGKSFPDLLREIEDQRQFYMSPRAVSRAPSSMASIVAASASPGQLLATGISAVQFASNPTGAVLSAAKQVARHPRLVDGPYYQVTGAIEGATDPSSKAQFQAFIKAFDTPERNALFESRSKLQAALLKGYQDDLKAVGRWSRGEQKEWSQAATILTKQAEILSYPETVQPIDPDFDLSSLEMAFGEECRSQMSTELTRIRKNADPNVPDDECERAQLWIHGTKGVGKSWFALEDLAKTRLPIINIRSEEQPVETLFEAPAAKSRYQDPVSGNKHLGILLHACIKAGCKNPIIVLDEFDKYFDDHATRLKDYLSRANRALEGPGDTEFPFTRATIIGIGNKPLADPALADRFTKIMKRYVLRHDKEKIAEKTAHGFVDKRARRDEPAANWIAERLLPQLPTILEENEARKIGGVRTMCDTIKAVFEQLELQWDEKRLDFDEEAMRRFIRDKFDGQAGKPEAETASKEPASKRPAALASTSASSSSVPSTSQPHRLLGGTRRSALSAVAVAGTSTTSVSATKGSGTSAAHALEKKLGSSR